MKTSDSIFILFFAWSSCTGSAQDAGNRLIEAGNLLEIPPNSAFLMFIIVPTLISLLFYRIYQRYKHTLSEEEQIICQLQEKVNHSDSTLHAFLAQQFGIVKKIALLEGYLREEEKGKELLKKVNRIIYEQDSFDWDVLYRVMNELHNGYFDKIKEAFPQLPELEYKICCLTKSGLSNTEIAILLRLNTNIIQIRKTAIRKRLAIPARGNIAQFMDAAIGG
jgi:DNA-binding CsgD family transcriptional regulator